MKTITLIAAADSHWGIGYQNRLLFHLKEDMKFFREKTIGNIVIMGRKTLESLPDAAPLPNRTNIVLTRTQAERWKARSRERGQNLLIAESMEEVRRQIERLKGEAFVIGGEEIYQEMLPLASEIYLTRVESERKADAFFPNLEQLREWKVMEVSEKFSEEDITFRFWHYRKRKEKES